LRFALVPHTLSATNLGERVTGERLNFEVDILGKYVESLLGHAALPQGTATGAIEPASLGKWGYGV
jgi:riboflavin synthase